ncbi:hypothetical protein DFH07DRAFT_862821 [Mycena maculata]|uniref:F-box domain-containing protein n=1 Tax=Mycena maculata TaxID=230809 RepID=A0AAD7MFZ1_9AGAR|nr:hypothetical protein DFH07DRAFT_862821 [Mycena maculata]
MDPNGISSLPSELICVVFSFTHTSATSGDRQLPFVHTLAHVSRFWRTLAKELCPELWTEIRIFHCRSGQLEMVNEHLRRSSGVPLDILMDLPFNVSGDWQLATFWPVVLRIWSVAHRWRVLRICTTDSNFSAIRNNVGRKTAPLLETLELRIGGQESYSQSALYLESLPTLKSLVLHGPMLETSQVSVFAAQLETLDLSSAQSSASFLMELVEQFDIVAQDSQAIPHLRRLTFRGTLPDLDAPHGPLFKSYMSSLTALTLGNIGARRAPNSFALLWPLLAPTLLEELSLEDIPGECLDTFGDSLKSAGLIFPALRTLRLASIESSTLPAYLRIAFPALAHLSLLHVDSRPFLKALSSDSDSEPVLWPNMLTLVLDNADYRALCSVVDARIAARCPLAVLEVDSPKFIDTSALQWLQTHVHGFKRSARA